VHEHSPSNAVLLGSALALAAGLAALDVAVGGGAVLIGLLVLAPLLAASRLGPLATGLVAAWCTALALVDGAADGFFGSGEHVGLVLAVVGAGAASVWLAHHRAESDRERDDSRFLAEAGAELDVSLDYESVLRTLARVAVPRLGDMCVVDMRAADGGLQRLAVAHADPGREQMAWEVGRVRDKADASWAATRVAASGEPELIPAITEETLRTMASNEEHLRLMRSLEPRSAALVALRSRREVLGTITVVTAGSGRRLGRRDLDLLERLAARAAQAVENARLYEASRAAGRSSDEGRILLDTLFERAPVGLAFIDRDLRYVRVNEALAQINGIPAADHVGRTLAELLPDMDPQVAEDFEHVMAGGEPIVDREVAGETPAAPGRRRTWLASFYPVRDPDGAIGGLGAVVTEITDRKAGEAALRRQKELYEALLGAQSEVGECVLILSGERVLYANRACEQITGYRLDELSALPSLLDIVAPEEREPLGERIRSLAADADVDPAYQTAVLHKDGRRVEMELAAKALSVSGEIQLVVVARDVTERHRAEQERARLLAAEQEARAAAERARAQATFLADASALMDQALDLDHTFNSITRLCVPYLGDICALDVLSPTGSLERVATAAADEHQQRLLGELAERYPIDPRGGHPVAVALRTGEVQELPDIGDDVYQGFARDEEHRGLLNALAFRRVLVAPLRARDLTLGALTIGRTDARAPYDADERTLVEDLVRRAALAIDNARLYEERSYVARTLQSSLLPAELPSIPGVEAAARYRAAGAANEVGGDFYDLFATHGEDWAVMVGDVCGKGAEAAAITALARYTLRAGAMHEDTPSRALALLNETLLRHGGEGEFCTVVHAALHRAAAGATVTLASGGHPLPLVLHPDGRVESVGEAGTVLGVVPDPRLSDVAVNLGPGDALVLYTDGVTEARANGKMFGREGLADLLAGCAGLDAAAIAARIEAEAVAIEQGEPRDDIAVVVLKVAG
jgi:PAS domain S-box-containing protein